MAMTSIFHQRLDSKQHIDEKSYLKYYEHNNNFYQVTSSIYDIPFNHMS